MPTGVQLPPDPPGQPQDPIEPASTQPWIDEGFASQLPVVPQVKPNIYDSAAPVFGFERPFNVGDLPRMNRPLGTPIAGVVAPTKSAPYSQECQRYEIYVSFSDPNGSCDLNVYLVSNYGQPNQSDAVIKSWTGATRFMKGLFVGGQDEILLGGQPIEIEVLNIQGSNCAVTVNVEGH